MRSAYLPVLLIILAVNFYGCFHNPVDLVPEKQEKHYLRGKSLLREGREEEALAAFLKVIEKRDDAAESHLEAGRLYLTFIRDPIAAIYHFRKYLELKPDSPQASPVRQLINTAKKEFARGLPGKPFESEFERLDLLELVEQVKSENRELKRQLILAKRGREGSETQLPASPSRGEGAASPPSSSAGTGGEADNRGEASERAEKPTAYIVQPGDNLNKISLKIYGTAGRWMDIFQANRDILASPHDLQVDQELRLP